MSDSAFKHNLSQREGGGRGEKNSSELLYSVLLQSIQRSLKIGPFWRLNRGIGELNITPRGHLSKEGLVIRGDHKVLKRHIFSIWLYNERVSIPSNSVEASSMGFGTQMVAPQKLYNYDYRYVSETERCLTTTNLIAIYKQTAEIEHFVRYRHGL